MESSFPRTPASTRPRFVCDSHVSYGSRLSMDHDKVLVALINTLLGPVIAGGPRRVCNAL